MKEETEICKDVEKTSNTNILYTLDLKFSITQMSMQKDIRICAQSASFNLLETPIYSSPIADTFFTELAGKTNWIDTLHFAQFVDMMSEHVYCS
jgi:hypothetical protein